MDESVAKDATPPPQTGSLGEVASLFLKLGVIAFGSIWPVLLAAIVSKADYLLTGDLTHLGGCLGRTIAGVRIALPGEYLRSR